MIYFCCDEQRRTALRLLNGIDLIVVLASRSALTAQLAPPNHDLILVRTFHPVPATLAREHVRITDLNGVFSAAITEAGPLTMSPTAEIPNPQNFFYVAVPFGELSKAISFVLTLDTTGQSPLAGFRRSLAHVKFSNHPRNTPQLTSDAEARRIVRDLNGIDYLEVLDAETPTESLRQRQLRVFFVKRLTPARLKKENFQIEGGERTRGITVNRIDFDPAQPELVTVETDRRGDFSIYTLRLASASSNALVDFDPLLSAIDFSFKVECPNDFDCQTQSPCPPESFAEPEIDYLAKDYASFRRLMLDRFSVLMPEWLERNAADLGITLVEMLAYVGDHLSYQQDAVATEAYLATARRRASVRRHARLVDYHMHDGSNARVWVQVRTQAGESNVQLAKGAQLFTKVERLDARIKAGSNDYEEARSVHAEFFETMHDATLYAAHNEINFYTWGERECCLPKGATRATLADDGAAGRLMLRPGDVLVFKEQLGPDTGQEPDANLKHRHAVRLTRVQPEASRTFDVGGERRTPGTLTKDPLTDEAIVEIEWDAEDALPFALCLSSISETSGEYVPNVSVALGNIVLADHGRTVRDETLTPVPQADARLATVPPSSGGCERFTKEPKPPRFRPQLKERPLTMMATVTRTELIEGRQRHLSFDPQSPASAAFSWEMERVLPAVTLDDDAGATWRPQRDLLSSDEFAPEFVAEVESDGTATLRFGDDEYGMRPAAGTSFRATYRVGNGTRGNIGAESLAHIITDDTRLDGVSNPLPASGGTDPETIQHVVERAPSAFRTQMRAVTPDDYVEVAERHPQVQRAAATMRWTGSWRTVFLTIDRLGGRPVDTAFEEEMRRHLERFRMAGHDVEINTPRYVPLEVEMTVCVLPEYFRGDVRKALLDVFSSHTRADGQRGVFHPDNFTFGQPVYLSSLYAAAQVVEGVRWVEVRKFQRFGSDSLKALDDGELAVGRLEIARLDNDPNFPERGVLRLFLEGGR